MSTSVPVPSQASAGAYSLGGGITPLNQFTPVIAARAPTSYDINYQVGRGWVNSVTLAPYELVGLSSASGQVLANWVQLGSTGNLSTVDADSGTAAPSSNILNMNGTTNQITTTASGSTIVWSVPSTFIAPGSIASTTTIAAGSTVTAATGVIATAGGVTATAGNIVASAGNISTTVGSITSATSVTATAGNITATNGNLILSGAAQFIGMKASAVTDFAGTANLTSGTVTVLNTNIVTGDLILISRISSTGSGASTTLGILTYSISTGASFTVTSLILGTPASTQTADNSSFAYMIVRPQ